MRFLLDQNVSPKVTASLRSLGHDAVDTRDLGLQRARDTTLWQRAGAEGRMLISFDRGFSDLCHSRRVRAWP